MLQNKQGSFEKLMALIEDEIANAEGGWVINERWNELVITQRVSRDPRRRNNGGEYDYYLVFETDGLGVEVYETWSCDFASRDQHGDGKRHFDCIVGVAGLRRMAQLADMSIASRAWLEKEEGSMDNLQAAIRSLNDSPAAPPVVRERTTNRDQYAAAMGCDVERVRFWDEMNLFQRFAARLAYGASNAKEYAYRVSWSSDLPTDRTLRVNSPHQGIS